MTEKTRTMLTEVQAAAAIGWSASNLRNRRRQYIDHGGPDGEHNDICPAFVRIRGGRGGERVYYARAEVDAWIRRNPTIARRAKIARDTLSQDDVCAMLSISRSALRARRARLNAGDETAAPPHVHAGQEVRYSRAAVVRWARAVRWDLSAEASLAL